MENALGCPHSCASFRIFSMGKVLGGGKESRTRKERDSVLVQPKYAR